MKKLENQVLTALKREKENKERYTFTLSPSTKDALRNWCTDNGVKESTAIEQMIRTVVPDKYFNNKS
jgi:hypothetical protein